MSATMQRILCLLLLSGVTTARGESIDWMWTHAASGMGTANVFDGGPALSQAGTISGPFQPTFLIAQSDFTRPGSFGAGAFFSARSRILEANEERFQVQVKLFTSYQPSLFAGGDNPGGMAEATLTSTIQFVMPFDGDRWIHRLGIIDNDPFFTGSTSVLVENVTQSLTMLSITSEVVPSELHQLGARRGDVIRISTFMEGMGDMGPGSPKAYVSEMDLIFFIPEPSTIALLGFATLLTLCRPKRGRNPLC